MRTLKLIILVACLALSSCTKEDPQPDYVKRPDFSNEVKMPVEVKVVKP